MRRSCENCKNLVRSVWWKFWTKPRMCKALEPKQFASVASTYDYYCGRRKIYWIKK